MEANYSNYDRSQIKLKFKAPNKAQRGFLLLSLQDERKEERKGRETVRLAGKGRGTMVYHFSNEASEQVGQVWAR